MTAAVSSTTPAWLYDLPDRSRSAPGSIPRGVDTSSVMGSVGRPPGAVRAYVADQVAHVGERPVDGPCGSSRTATCPGRTVRYSLARRLGLIGPACSPVADQ